MSNLAWIQVKKTAKRGRDINLPESVTHRSVQGDTLILVPGHSYEVTTEEWNLIKTEHKDLLKDITVLREPEAPEAPEQP